MECKYNQDEFCTNDQCPMCADYCPVPDTEGICRYEEREEDRWVLTPQGCLKCAFIVNGVNIEENVFNNIWNEFSDLMMQHEYIEERD